MIMHKIIPIRVYEGDWEGLSTGLLVLPEEDFAKYRDMAEGKKFFSISLKLKKQKEIALTMFPEHSKDMNGFSYLVICEAGYLPTIPEKILEKWLFNHNPGTMMVLNRSGTACPRLECVTNQWWFQHELYPEMAGYEVCEQQNHCVTNFNKFRSGAYGPDRDVPVRTKAIKLLPNGEHEEIPAFTSENHFSFVGAGNSSACLAESESFPYGEVFWKPPL